LTPARTSVLGLELDSRSRRSSSGVSVGIAPDFPLGMRFSTPIGTVSSPTLFAHATKFGDMHTRTACPSFPRSTASGSAGCTSPSTPTTVRTVKDDRTSRIKRGS
jgi:hypothetical protein